MEHRWSLRRPLSGQARVYHKGVQILESSIGDIGLEGMFIRDGTTALGRDTPVEVEFVLPGEGPRVHRLAALIAHCGDEGVGLSFQRYDPRAFRAIQTFLYEPHMEE